MVKKETRVERVIVKLKNNPLIAIVIVLGTIVITLSAFTNAVQNLLGLIPDKPDAPIFDVSGHWVAEETDKTPFTNFNFKIVDNQVFGTVQRPPSFAMSQGVSGIIDGKIVGDEISFTTKHEYIQQFGSYNFETKQRSPDIRKELITHYQGKISENTIDFMIQTNAGYYAEATAKRVIDKTAVSKKKVDNYTYLYTLPGHEGGTYSISFGPEKGRYSNGGLRLTTGGVKDCLVKWWNLATAEPHGKREMCQYLPEAKARVIVAYRSKKRNAGAIDLQSVTFADNRDRLVFYDWSFFPNHTAGGGGYHEIAGFEGLIVISANLTRIATAEIDESGLATASIRYMGGDIVKSFDCKEKVSALALNKNASLITIAEKKKPEGSMLRLCTVEDKTIKWAVETKYSISLLAFNENNNMLATGGLNNNIIEIRELKNGSLRLTLTLDEKDGVSSLVFSDDGVLFAAGGLKSGIIRIWDVKDSFTLIQTLSNKDAVGALAFSRNNRLLAAGGAVKGAINIWGKSK